MVPRAPMNRLSYQSPIAVSSIGETVICCRGHTIIRRGSFRMRTEIGRKAQRTRSRPQPIFLAMLRYLLPCLIFGWLTHQLWSEGRDSLEVLWENSGHWPEFVLATFLYLIAVIGTFLRWRLLVLAIQLPFSVADALRLGFIGYVLQYVSLGSLGGDVFKAILIARQQPQRKPEAAATVLVDRLVGFFGLTLLVLMGIGFFDKSLLGPYAMAKPVCIILGLVGTAVAVLIIFTRISLISLMRLRLLRPLRGTIYRIQAALDLYRKHALVVMAAIAMAVITQFLQATSVYLAARAFFPQGPGLSSQIFMWGVAGIVGAIPIVPGGLGTFDIAYKTLYEGMSTHGGVPDEGFIVAILFRVMCLVVVAVGITMFWIMKGQVRAANDDALSDPGLGYPR